MDLLIRYAFGMAVAMIAYAIIFKASAIISAATSNAAERWLPEGRLKVALTRRRGLAEDTLAPAAPLALPGAQTPALEAPESARSSEDSSAAR